MTIYNGSLETQGTSSGEADGWALTVSTPMATVATFNTGFEPFISLEQFDVGWNTDPYLIDPDDGAPGTPTFYSDTIPVDTESFDDWNNGKTYAFDVNTGISMEFTSDTPPDVVLVEQFDEGWNTDTWTAEPLEGTTFEDDFNTGWTTDTWESDVLTGTDAMFDEGMNDIELFEESWPDILFVADDSTDVCTATDMPSFGPPADGFKCTIVSTGAYPGGIVENQVYYLRDVAALGGGFTFKLSKTFGGSAINITDAGIGSQYLHSDPVTSWTRFEE